LNDSGSVIFHCVTLVHHQILAHLLFGPMSNFLLATLLYYIPRAVTDSQWQDSLLLHKAFPHPVFPECGLLWVSRSSASGTTASLYEPPPFLSLETVLRLMFIYMAIQLPVTPACLQPDHRPSLVWDQVCLLVVRGVSPDCRLFGTAWGIRSLPRPIIKYYKLNITYSSQAVVCTNNIQIMEFLFSFFYEAIAFFLSSFFTVILIKYYDETDNTFGRNLYLC